jgi:hypothetical protein
MAPLQIVEPFSADPGTNKFPDAVCHALLANGITVERMAPSQASIQFADNPLLLGKIALRESLPATIIDRQLVLVGRYPDRRELTEWLNLDVDVLKVSRCCCGSGRRCCWCGRY